MIRPTLTAKHIFMLAAVTGTIACGTLRADAQTPALLGATQARPGPVVGLRDDDGRDYEAIVPVVQGWYKGRISLYLSTDSSQQGVSRATHTNFVPKLAGAIAGQAVDDIYQLTNFKQGNILPSSPNPAGPENRDLNYTPLWQLSLVTWVSGQPYTLKSEEEVLAQKTAGHVRVVKTNVVINCPVIFTPSGGLLYGVRILR